MALGRSRRAVDKLPPMIRATLWDFGGVIMTGPFDAFSQYEAAQGLPEGFIRRVNATNPHTNAWACLERGQIDRDEFCRRFEAERSEERRVGKECRSRWSPNH